MFADIATVVFGCMALILICRAGVRQYKCGNFGGVRQYDSGVRQYEWGNLGGVRQYKCGNFAGVRHA